jgi:Putative zinc-finger
LICEKTVSNRTNERDLNERDLKASIRELAAALESTLEEHPAPEELQDLAAGDLSDPERQRIEEHLALCRECTRAALELAESLEPERRGTLITDDELEVQWERFRAKVAPPSRRWGWGGLALAAVLLVAVGGAVVWGLFEASRPRTDVFVADLYSEPVRGEEKPTQIPSWARRISLRLNLDAPVPATRYRVEIVAEGDRRIWGPREVPLQMDSVVVDVPARLLPEGRYEIRLSGPRGQPVDVYDVRIETAAEK